MTHTRRKLDGAKIREIRQDNLGITQIELAEILKLSRDTVSRWENGECQPTPKRLLDLARILDADLDAISTRVPAKDAA